MSAGRDPVMSRPLKVMRPRVGARKCVSRLKQVVFPAPFGPISAWMVPRCTRRLTSFTATKPRNSLVSSWVSRMVSAVISGRSYTWRRRPARSIRHDGRRVEPRLATLDPRAVGHRHLVGAHALVLRPHDVLDQVPGIGVERGVEEPLGVGGGRPGRVAGLVDHAGEDGVDRVGRGDPVHEAHGPGLRGRDVVVQERQLLGAPEADDAGQAEDGAVGDQGVPRGAQPDHGVGRGDPDVAGHRELEAAADGIAVEHGDRQLAHVLERVQRADPVPVERLVDPPRGQGFPVHARGEGAARPADHHDPHPRVGGRRLRRLRELGGERDVERVQHVRPVQREGRHPLRHLVEDARLAHGCLPVRVVKE